MVDLPPTNTKTNPNWKILIIDDDEEDFLIARNMLREAKGQVFETEWAGTFAAGRKALIANHYNAVLVDYNLGTHSGIELIREANESGYAAPLILFTDRGNYEVDVEAMQAGATLYLTKDEANPLLLERAIRYAAELKQRENDLRLSRERLEQELAERRRAEEALRDSESRLREFLENTHDTYFALNSEWRVTYANRRFGELMHVDAQDLIGKNFWEVFPHYLGTDVEQHYRKVMAERVPVHFQRAGIYTDLLYEISLYPTWEGLASFAVDRTEAVRHQKQLENERARLDAILQAIPVAVWITNPEGRVIGKNEQADRIWGGDAPMSESIEQYRAYEAWDTLTGQRLEPEEYPIAVALQTGLQVEQKELRIRRFDGSEGFVLVSATPIQDQQGRLTGVVGINLDITARKQAEQAFQTSLAQAEKDRLLLEALMENVLGGITITGGPPDFPLEKVSRYGLELLRNPNHPALLGKPAGEHQSDWKIFLVDGKTQPSKEQMPLYRASHFGEIVRNQEMVVIRGDGVSIPLLIDAAPIRDDQGQIKGAISTWRDITEIKQTDRILRESNEKIIQLLENMSDGFFSIDREWRMTYVNRRAAEQGGQTPEDLVGRNLWEAQPRLIGTNLEAAYRRVMETRQFEITEFHSPRSGRWFELHIQPWTDGISINSMDITERKKSEQLLHESQAQLQARTNELQAILDAVPAFMWITHDPQAREMTGNSLVVELMHMRPGDNLSKTGPSPDRLRHFKAVRNGIEVPNEELPVQKVAASGQPLRDYELDLVFENGEVRHLFGNVSPLLDEYGQPAGAVSAFIDVTKNKQAEKALFERDEILQLAVSAANAGIWSWDLDTNNLTWSDEYYRIFGYEPGSVEPSVEAGLRHIHPDDRERVAAVVQAASEQGMSIDEIHRVVWPDGSVHWVRGLSQVLRDDRGSPFRMAGIALDVTEQKLEEETLARYSEQLARSNQELEQFAFVASHDLQEPLRKIIMFGGSLRRHLSDQLDDTANGYLDRMQNAAERMQVMIDGLLDLSRVNIRGRAFSPTQLNRVVEEVMSDLEPRVQAVGGQVVVEDLPTVEGDEVQLRELFQNLIGNALKFHRPGVPPRVQVTGMLKRTTNAPLAEIRVADNGIGFPQENAERIFQPFQRLHGRSEFEGSGLGLAICKKIVERHHGTIEVHSAPGEGTVFTVRIPVKTTAS